VRLVLEMCDRGSLRGLLDSGGLRDAAGGQLNMGAVLECALDVARAMVGGAAAARLSFA
jgi:hypothetical protein